MVIEVIGCFWAMMVVRWLWIRTILLSLLRSMSTAVVNRTVKMGLVVGDELKPSPSPFPGAIPKVSQARDGSWWIDAVWNSDDWASQINISVGGTQTRAEAIELWNKRA
jgi:hypothetical protein